MKYKYRNVDKEIEAYKKLKRERLQRLREGSSVDWSSEEEIITSKDQSKMPKYKERLNISVDSVEREDDQNDRTYQTL